MPEDYVMKKILNLLSSRSSRVATNMRRAVLIQTVSNGVAVKHVGW